MTPNDRLRKILEHGVVWDEKYLAGVDRTLALQYKEALTNIRAQIEWMYRKYGDDVSYSDMMQYNRLLGLEKEFAEEIKTLTGENVKLTRNSIKTIYKENYNLAGYAAESTLDARLGFGQLNTSVINSAVLNPMDRITWIDRESETGKKALQNISEAVTQSLIQGEGYSKTAAKLKDVLEISAGRTSRIVRTEAHRAQSAGRLLAFDKTEKAAETLGIEVRKQWMATMDERTRDSHAKMNGKLADEDGMFHIPSTDEHGPLTCEGPGLTGYPGEDIHCRCTVVVAFKDLPFETEEMKEITYDEWAEQKGIKTERTVSQRAIKVETRQDIGTIKEAEEWALNERGITANYSSAEWGSKMNEAIRTLPEDMGPDYISTVKDAFKWADASPQYRVEDYIGVTCRKRNGQTSIGINTEKYKTMKQLDIHMKETNKRWLEQTGNRWFFNDNAEAVPFHEMGHVFQGIIGEDPRWKDIAEEWIVKSNCEMIGRSSREAFAEAWAAYHTGNVKGLTTEVVEFIKECKKYKLSPKTGYWIKE